MNEHEQYISTITRTHTAFDSFDDLLNAAGGYFPSLLVSSGGKRGQELTILADAYDAAQEERGDQRRACRS